MQRSANRFMNDLKGGEVVMESLEAEQAVRRAREPGNERGQDPVAVEVGLLRQDQVFQCKEAPHPVNAGSGCLGEAFGGKIGVWTVSTVWVTDWAVPVPDWPGFRMSWRESSVCKGWTRFESQLGPSVPAGQGPFLCFFVWTVSTLLPLM